MTADHEMPIIGLAIRQDDDGNWWVLFSLGPIPTEAQADSARDYIKATLCDQEIKGH